MTPNDPTTLDPEGTEADTGPEQVHQAEVIELDEASRLRKQLDEQAARLRAVSKAYTDLQADMDAYRKRQQLSAAMKADKRAAEAVEKFFEPVQNLKRMLEAGGDVDSLTRGATMVLHQFERSMVDLGLSEVPGVGSTFDPKVHEALAVMPVADPAEDGRVVQVFKNGYFIGDRVLQAAQVIIGKFDAAGAEA